MTDLNFVYVPKPYPKRLYLNHVDSIVVAGEAEHEAALASGYMLYTDLPPHVDVLDDLVQGLLVERMVAHDRKRYAAWPREALIAAIRTAEAPKDILPPDLDGDGNPGGSRPDGDDPDQAEIDRLRAEIEALGGSYHHKNRAPALQEKLAALKVAG